MNLQIKWKQKNPSIEKILSECSQRHTHVMILYLRKEPEIEEEDMYMAWKALEKEINYLNEQEGYIRFEIKHLRHELLHAKKEIKRIQSVPLVIGQVIIFLLFGVLKFLRVGVIN